ncbi:hypothetical protein [Haloarchaeobius sp. TZWSO28]|uniref:hypothetical protein n=1 Tax=Haloarchaeobius sp. TZWSO28 TaxID=3446119 RepID=UPI003EBC872B
MPAVWTYPWNLYTEGPEDAFATLREHGIDTVNLATSYHSVRSMNPRTPEQLFVERPGGLYFDPGDAFADVPITPRVDDGAGVADQLADLCTRAEAENITVNAWTVCLHNSRLGAKNPDFRIESAFGDAHDHSLCPSHQAVRDYFAALAGAIATYDIGEIQLESVGFPGVFHGHSNTFGHDKRAVLTDQVEEVLLSQCFCSGCREAATDLDMDAAQTVVRELVTEAMANPHDGLPSLEALTVEYPVLDDLFSFRASVVTELVEAIADAAGDVPVNYYVGEAFGFDVEDLWPSGVRLTELAGHVDRFTALCYVSDPAVARRRLGSVQELVDEPVDVGLTLDPEAVPDADTLATLVEAVRAETDGDVFVYHHGLASEAQLEWIADAIR